MLGSKRFKSNPVLDHELHPLSADLKNTLTLITKDFNNSRLMSMDIINAEGRLFGFLTSYVSNNFCWIQPTKTRSKASSVEYHKYTKAVNTKKINMNEEWMYDIFIGKHCVAQYEVDMRWYRAVVVGEPVDDKWLIQFIDYGNYQRCTVDQLREPIREAGCDHFDVPLQAVCCRLYNIVPKLPEYRDEIDARLEDFYAKHCMDYLEIVVRNIRPDYVIDCDVFLSRSHGPQDFYRRHIGQELVDLGLATFADPHKANAIKPFPMDRIDIDCGKQHEDIKPGKVSLKKEEKPRTDFKPNYKYQTVSFF